MPTEKTILLYEFDELDDKAKENARDWFRSVRDSTDLEFVVDDFARVAEMMGFEFRTHIVKTYGGMERHEPNIWWSLGYVQGDYAGFEARYSYAKGSILAVASYAPKDETLLAIARSLFEMQKANQYKITAAINFNERRGFSISEILRDGEYMNGSDAETHAESVIHEACKDLSHWLYHQLREEDMAQCADDVVDENIRANEYTFTETGRRED